ncbi:hypothetical protein BDZ90DRAFT_48507 [Jaminaea rosea]|uniref:Galactose mutarotase-like protein n=1 Tax=Jaminaea rosea TaxID=1569628 RepID=A0A316ULN2_9BASI|nr:hypothetical protein BDZ90DRAFT_48507 [Jaminaea rosea]PWN26202.1 hypothetical protein BDZ90DRAFT_48507 [Jaminaea rosea]
MSSQSPDYINPFEPVVLRLASTASASSPLEVHVLPYGLTIHRLVIDDGKEDLITGPESPSDHHTLGRSFFGPIVGRFANRLPAGQNSFNYDSTEVGSVDLPEWGGDGVCHHGGPAVGGEQEGAGEPVKAKKGQLLPQRGPFDRMVWTKLEEGQMQLFDKLAEGEPQSKAIFALHSIGAPAGHQGFHGDIRIEVRIALKAAKAEQAETTSHTKLLHDSGASSSGSVSIEYRASLLPRSSEVQVTPFNLTHHWGFNLTASQAKDEASSRIDDHQLRLLPSDVGRLALDERGIATGEILKLDEAHGWTSSPSSSPWGKRVATAMPQQGYDDFYLWPTAAGNDTASLPAVALLSSPASSSSAPRTSLVFRTDQHGVQFYSANGQPAAPAPPEESGGARKLAHRRDGEQQEGNAMRTAAFLEFGEPHCCFLRPRLQEFVRASKDVGLLRKGETYVNRVEVEIWQSKAQKA